MKVEERILRNQLLFHKFGIKVDYPEQKIIALAGNPNTGKSTVFNALTGLHQHTGNWHGKTVGYAQGSFTVKDESFLLIDLPGTYSLLPNSAEEQIARDFICFGKPDVTVVVVDATALERHLNLTFQVMEITNCTIMCINLMDEAKKKGIQVDLKELAESLGIPVVGTSARKGEGLSSLQQQIFEVAAAMTIPSPISLRYNESLEKKISQLELRLTPLLQGVMNPRWVALRLLDGDDKILKEIEAWFTNPFRLPLSTYQGVAPECLHS